MSTDSPELLDRLPPHSIPAERGVLGCILLSPGESLDACAGLPAETFYDLRHRKLFETLRRMHETRKPVDLVTIAQTLADAGTEQAAGGIAYVSGLVDAIPSAENLPFYAETLREKLARRQVLQFAAAIAGKARDESADPETLLAELETGALAIRGTEPGRTAIAGRQSAEVFIADAQERHNLAGRLSGITSGIPDLDAMTGGFQPGELVVVGARPSIGKTAFATSTAIAAAIEAETATQTLFISLETSARAILRRFGCAIARVPISDFRAGAFRERDFQRMTAAAARIKGARLTIEDHVSGGLTGSRLRSLVRRHVRQNGVRLVLVDYLQKLKPDARHEKRTYEVASVSEALKAAAEENQVAVIALAQLNRDAEDEDRLPSLRDLADSGQIERDADVVVLLHRKRTEKEGPAKLIVAKQRDGETGIVTAHYVGRFCRFYPATRQEEEPAVESMQTHP